MEWRNEVDSTRRTRHGDCVRHFEFDLVIASSSGFDISAFSFACMTLSRIPLTNCDDWAEPNRLASSTASSTATAEACRCAATRRPPAARRCDRWPPSASDSNWRRSARSAASSSARFRRTPATNSRAKLDQVVGPQPPLDQLIAVGRIVAQDSDRPGKGPETRLHGLAAAEHRAGLRRGEERG